MKERVGQQFGIEERQVRNLIMCAQLRPKLPQLPGSVLPEKSDGPHNRLAPLVLFENPTAGPRYPRWKTKRGG